MSTLITSDEVSHQVDNEHFKESQGKKKEQVKSHCSISSTQYQHGSSGGPAKSPG